MVEIGQTATPIYSKIAFLSKNIYAEVQIVGYGGGRNEKLCYAKFGGD